MKYAEFVKMDEQGNSHWWYATRQKLLRQALDKLPTNSNNLSILDLASACGNNFAICSDYGKIFGIDISWHAIRYCKQKKITTIVQGNAQNLPFKSSSYDIVVALDVFEHLADDLACMKEIRRVLKENGKLIFNAPAFKRLFSYHDKAFSHIRRYGASELKEKLNSANLHVRYITYWSFFIFPAVFIVRKIFNRRKMDDKEVLSDFHRRIHPFINRILELLCKIELVLIKRGISLPFGISLYGVAIKKGRI